MNDHKETQQRANSVACVRRRILARLEDAQGPSYTEPVIEFDCENLHNFVSRVYRLIQRNEMRLDQATSIVFETIERCAHDAVRGYLMECELAIRRDRCDQTPQAFAPEASRCDRLKDCVPNTNVSHMANALSRAMYDATNAAWCDDDDK